MRSRGSHVTLAALRNVAIDSADMRHNADTRMAMLER
jgi:hypothetical protein